MKHNLTIKTLLGLSQEEMAMILGVSRIQWAMYETGRRDVPLSAKEQLAALLSHTQQAKSVSKESIKIIEDEKRKENEWLQLEHKAVNHKKEILERKIRVMENSRVECFAALEVVDYLESQPENELIDGLAKSIKIRVKNSLSKNSLHRLQEMQFKKENLEMLKNTLQQKINENTNKL